MDGGFIGMPGGPLESIFRGAASSEINAYANFRHQKGGGWGATIEKPMIH